MLLIWAGLVVRSAVILLGAEILRRFPQRSGPAYRHRLILAAFGLAGFFVLDSADPSSTLARPSAARLCHNPANDFGARTRNALTLRSQRASPNMVSRGLHRVRAGCDRISQRSSDRPARQFT